MYHQQYTLPSDDDREKNTRIDRYTLSNQKKVKQPEVWE